jgi:hypothetical protein
LRFQVRVKPLPKDPSAGPGARAFGLSLEPGASPFFNPMLAAVACPGVGPGVGPGSGAWASLPLRAWAAELLAPRLKKHARNAAARRLRAARRPQQPRHTPAQGSTAAGSTATAAAAPAVRVSGVAALMAAGVVRASAVLLASPPSAWPLHPRLSVLLYHRAWLHASPAYALVTGCPAPGPPSSSGVEGGSLAAAAAVAADGADAVASLEAWRREHPVQIGPCDASQRRAVALALKGESFVLRGPPGCGKTNTLAAMVYKNKKTNMLSSACSVCFFLLTGLALSACFLFPTDLFYRCLRASIYPPGTNPPTSGRRARGRRKARPSRGENAHCPVLLRRQSAPDDDNGGRRGRHRSSRVPHDERLPAARWEYL